MWHFFRSEKSIGYSGSQYPNEKNYINLELEECTNLLSSYLSNRKQFVTTYQIKNM